MSESIEAILPRVDVTRETVRPLAVASMKRSRRLWYQGDQMLDIKREIVTLAEWPDALKVGEPCIITDEPAGTLLRMTVTPAGVAETTNAQTGQCTVALEDGDMIGRMLHVFGGNDAPVTLFGFKCGSEAEGWTLRIADCYIGDAEHGRWLLDSGETELTEVCAALALPRVGVVYTGAWDPAIRDVIGGGWVVKPAIERVDPERGRVAVHMPRDGATHITQVSKDVV